ncbi:MAG: hybrid sensor histidine kinase/response regulator, partial [Candidatus Dormibacteria bacterium]
METLDIDEVIDEVLRLTTPLAAARAIELVAPHREPEGRVLADHQRVKQILLNLISNAIKYNREGGRVELHSQPVEGGGWRLEVRDTGPGLSDADQARLFSPFERLSAATTEVEGTGLGLALSRTMAEAMGGSVGVRSRLGEGSTFWVELPPAVAARAVRASRRSAPDPVLAQRSYPRERRVLYVEDTASNLRLVEGIVTRRPNLHMETAQTGEEALVIAGTLLPHLVLLDLHLPDLPGEQVLERLRAAAPTTDVPVVMLSADATQAQADRLLAAGANDYLTKPIDVRRLLRLL